MYSYVYQTPNKSIVLFGLIFFSQIWKKNREIMPVKTVTSPSSARLHTVCQTKMGCQARHMTRVKANFLFHASLPCLVQ